MGWFTSNKKLFLKAAEEGDRDFIGNSNRDWMAYTDDSGDNALHKASRGGHPDIINMLAPLTDIDRRNKAGETSLIIAAANGHKDAVKKLLQHHANIHYSDQENHTALYYAVSNGHLSCVQLLLPNKPDLDTEKLLLAAIKNAHPEIAIALIKAGAKIDIHDDDYDYAIHLAIAAGMSDVVRAMIAAGADLTLKDSYTNTPLHSAVADDDEEILQMLVDAGAPLDIEDNEGNTPLQFARAEELPLLIKILTLAEKNAKNKKPHHETQDAVSVLVPASKSTSSANKDTEEWVLLGKDKIAQICTHPALGRQITEIFNFTSMDRRVITTNLSLKTESISPAESLDTLSDDILGDVYARFKKLGGKADEQSVFKNRMMKKRLGDGTNP
jgi:ankyrin repeat protein